MHYLKVCVIDFRAGFQISLRRECAQHLWRTLSGKMVYCSVLSVQYLVCRTVRAQILRLFFVAMAVGVSVGPRGTPTLQWSWAITSARPSSVTGTAHSTPPSSPQMPMESWSLLGPARDTAMWVPHACANEWHCGSSEPGWILYELYIKQKT